MFFSVARLRLAALFLFALPLVHAHEDVIFTSSVSYCAPPENLLVEQFDVAYFPSNNSLVFNVSAASVQANVNVSANLFLNVYGMHPVNITLDICTLFNGALCPLPLYVFNGSETLPLPSSLKVSADIPKIAYKIPDLEAFAQLTLTEVGTGQLKACIQSTLSNGWSTHQPGVSWGIGGLAFLALLSSVWQSFLLDSIAPFRFLDLLGLYQTIASSGFFDLNYPVVYRAFTLNFSWAMGLFSQSPTSSIQDSITKMRHLTGGNLAGSTAGGSVALVNRKFSPYSTYVVPQSLIAAAQALPHVDLSVPTRPLLAPNDILPHHLVAREVQTVTSQSPNVLDAGVPIYVNTIGIATANAFMTAFFSALILLAIALAFLLMIYGVVAVASRQAYTRPHWIAEIKPRFPLFVRAWGLRIALICFFPLVTFALYQWTLEDSWLSIVISVVTFLIVLGIVGGATLRVLLFGRRSSPWLLAEDLPAHGPLYGQYRISRFYFFALPLLAIFVRSILIAAAKNKGTVQIVGVICVELFLLLSHVVLKPGKTRRSDVLSIYLAITRLVTSGLLVAFIVPVALPPIPRVVIGIIVLVLFSIAVVVMFVNTLWNLGLQHLWVRRPFTALRSRGTASQGSVDKDAEKELEKGNANVTSRPLNPTPMHGPLVDPAMNAPEALSQVTPTTTYAEPSSAHSTDTSASYGAQVPSRWRSSFPLSPPSRAGSESAHGDVPPLSPPSRNSPSRQPTIDEIQPS
ncbi:TRP-domain-containing protein [Lactarius akahatsu]|uniref:TRP-domain-containing protein n=1 Tax=Lactarius akahatsu TaxID=416441 RepID=A0AAD4QAD2_9AGAM|nr:TRP-domain-containing protein [Lactarius akahatsu]